ncbi:hypothetical protein [Tenggerimyces flavus]|uniref:Lipoprotein n=1 Tax=Tenggerimyces flavus TaxID=1708749 RepID=A0ABV7YHB4_9ACTN|nr:hypothetical protein [Tenggerimyces flavus]MBM7788077.1 hypothetical protein [Tenggerimyces flavus]
MRHALRKALAASGVLALLVAASCGQQNDPAAAPTTPAPEKTTAAPSPEHSEHTAEALMPKGTGDPFADSRAAAGHMPMTATALATGFAQAAGIEGALDSKAAELRSGLTYLLTEHVYLAGIAVATAYAKGADSPEFKLAAKTLDANSQAVGAAVASIVGKEQGDTFLQSWRSHINDFVAYAVAAKTKDAKGKQEAVDNLMAYAKAAGRFFDDATGGTLPAAAVQKEFETHISSLAKAVDGFAENKPTAYDDLRAAAAHMPMSATALAGGIAKATKMAGDPNDAASTLRANLTAALTEHVYLAGIAVFTAYTAGADSPAFKAATATLDANSVAISKAVGSLSDQSTEETFLEAWRSHINDFVSYAVAAAGKDEAGKKEALANLSAYTVAAGGLISETTKGALPAEAVTAELVGHAESLAGAIDSLAAALT